MSGSVSSLSVVVRSCGERTSDLCRHTLLKEFQNSDLPNVDNISVVGSRSFVETLILSLQNGINADCQWHLVVDADVIPNTDGVRNLLEWTHRVPSNVSVIQPHVVDKLLGQNRPAGVHLYRCSYLQQLIELSPLIPNSVRPETALLTRHSQVYGTMYVNIPVVFGGHDFEQYNKDIYRKSFLHAIKHRSIGSDVMEFWTRRMKDDPDYLVAIAGYLSGLASNETGMVDQQGMDSLFMALDYNIEEKAPINIKNYSKFEYSNIQDRPIFGVKSMLNFPHVKLENKTKTFLNFIQQYFKSEKKVKILVKFINGIF